MFLLFTASHDRQINGNWRRESKRRQQYSLLSSFLLLPAPNPPSSIPYITFTQMIFAQDYKTHKRVDSKNNRKFIDLTPSIFCSTESKKSKKTTQRTVEFMTAVVVAVSLLLQLCYVLSFFLLLLIKQNISIEYLFCSCCCCECVKQKKSYTFDLIKKYTIFGSLLVSRYSQR